MRLDELVLVAIGEGCEVGVRGRTRLQKLLYFVCEKLAVDARYSPHYYGPYSDEVARATQSLVARGLVREEVQSVNSAGPFEGRLHAYTAADPGRELLEVIRKEHREDYQRASAELARLLEGNPSTRALAVASKLHMVVGKSSGPVRVTDLERRAAKFGWRVSPADVSAGVRFLIDRHFVKGVPRAGRG